MAAWRFPRSLVALALVCAAASPAGAAEAPKWSFTGTWPMALKCQGYSHVTTLKVRSAGPSSIVGTSTSDNATGTFTGGSFDGVNVTFGNRFKLNGHWYSEVWKGKLSQGGTVFKGRMKGENQPAPCTLSGVRS